jgi:uncharacterized protein
LILQQHETLGVVAGISLSRQKVTNKRQVDYEENNDHPLHMLKHTALHGDDQIWLCATFIDMLIQQIREDMKSAMKAKEQVKLDTLRGVISACTNELVAKGMKPTDEITDDMATTVLKRLAKQRKDSIEQFTKGGRAELAEKETTELKVIETYLPQMASKEEILKVAEAKKSEMGITDPSGQGKLMGAIIKEFAGRADGADVKEVVASLFK